MTSFAPTTNHCRRLREGFETQPVSTVSTSLVIDSDISEVISSSIELSETGYFLWRGYCHYSGIKNSIPGIQNLCKYTWEVVLCMVLTGKRLLEPNIWLKTLEQLSLLKIWWDQYRARRCIGNAKQVGLRAGRYPSLARKQDLWVGSTDMAILLLIGT